MADQEFDMDSAVGAVAEGLGFGGSSSEEHSEEERTTQESQASLDLSDDDQPAAHQEVEEATDVTQAPVTTKPAPKSWAKDTHAIWEKLPLEAQAQIEKREQQILQGLEQYKEHNEFGRTMKEVMSPYKPFLNSQGVDEAKAVQYLLNAHYRLTHGSPQEKQQYWNTLAQSYGIQSTPQGGQTEEVSPHVKALQDKLGQLEGALTARQQAEFQALREQTAKDVDAFASDPAHPHFDDVADDIVALLKTGMELKDAYEKAVWANPVTRAKEIARLQTEEKQKLLSKSRKEAEEAKKAASTNVRGRDTKRTPTESLGTMEDTMKETLKTIRERAVH